MKVKISVRKEQGKLVVKLFLLDNGDWDFSHYLPVYYQTKCVEAKNIRLELDGEYHSMGDLIGGPVKLEIWECNLPSRSDNFNLKKMVATRRPMYKCDEEGYLQIGEFSYIISN